ncbi:MAG TPA: 16S rRNA (adenine(1518)-N(6)/adenine(1519)-N(6))-dimethyltransferase RsmA [Clostridia bacterium]|nr:16S rRNA (adenine(1518)-N(6)/adenine(1519)-N(6))-dimethyltransferase RsmA [Clostridia bacterium]
MDDNKFNLKEILSATGFRFNKNLGQNFLTDTNLLNAIVVDAGVEGSDTVVEIGTGAGTLTRSLAESAKKVFSFELDQKLKPVLDLTLQGFDNVEVVFRDVLKMSDEELTQIVGGKFKVVANLPYYITTPMIMRFLDSSLQVQSLTVMVQKEVADRFVANPKSKDYAAITLAIEMCGECKVTRSVNRNMFFPSPNVDSAVVRIDIKKGKVDESIFDRVKKLVHSAFAMRRKTLENNLSAAFGISKLEAGERMARAGIKAMARGEELSLEDYKRLAKEF